MIICLFSDQIKNETLNNHQQLEKILVGRLKGIKSTEDYLRLLQLFYAYFGGLEALFEKYLEMDKIPDYPKRRKANSLLKDIHCLDAEPGSFAAEEYLPSIHGHLQCLGALYVFEGSTLGGSIIVQMISKHLPLLKKDCFHYFTGYGPNNHVMWQQFKTLLNMQVLTPANAAAVIEAANHTFKGFENWLIKND